MRRSKIRPKVSNKGAIPPKVRENVIRRSGGWCEVAVDPMCQRQGGHLHHKLPRSAGGPHVEDNLLDTCPSCHRWIHSHPAASYDHGWLLRRE